MNTQQTESSLTSPSDKSGSWRPVQGKTSLTDQETDNALKVKIDNKTIDNFRKIDRCYADPIYSNQIYGLHSFIPSKGATPDKDGIFGMAKFRGTFNSLEEADARAEFLLRNCDSYHKIFYSFTGKPFPMCSEDAKFASETKKIDIKKNAIETISNDVKEKRRAEAREIAEIKKREKEFQEDIKKENDDDDESEKYTVLRVKKAQLVWTYVETRKKMEEMKNSIIFVRKEIEKADKRNPELKNIYYDKYMQARKESGLDTSTDESFMKFLVEDLGADLGF